MSIVKRVTIECPECGRLIDHVETCYLATESHYLLEDGAFVAYQIEDSKIVDYSLHSGPKCPECHQPIGRLLAAKGIYSLDELVWRRCSGQPIFEKEE